MIPNIINAYPLSRSTKSAWNGNGCYDEGTIDNMLCKSKWLLDHETLNTGIDCICMWYNKKQIKTTIEAFIVVAFKKGTLSNINFFKFKGTFR